MNGTLYGVSVGPGDPELLTLKAVRIIESCDVVAAPCTAGEKTLALDIAMGAADLTGKAIVTLPFLMTRDKSALAKSHRAAADTLAVYLRAGCSVAMLNLGDVSIYSSFCYLMELLISDGFTVEMIPGVTSFCATAAALNISLTTMQEPLHIIPAGSMNTAEALSLSGTKVLMKTGRDLSRVKEEICCRGLENNTLLVQNCGLPNEKICRNITEASDEISYFTTIVVKEGE